MEDKDYLIFNVELTDDNIKSIKNSLIDKGWLFYTKIKESKYDNGGLTMTLYESLDDKKDKEPFTMVHNSERDYNTALKKVFENIQHFCKHWEIF